MSYMNRQRPPPQNEQLQSFVNNVKREIDIFWTNILDEFNTFSTEITDKLNTIEQDYDKYRQTQPQKHNNTSLNTNRYTNNNHRSSFDISNNNKNKNKNNRNNSNKRDDRDKDTDDAKSADYHQQKEQYKKFAKNGNNISMGHGRTLSTMEIPTSFKLEPIEESILIIKPRAATTHCKDIYTTLLDENFYVTDFEEGRADASYFEKLWAKKYGYVSYFKELCAEMGMDTFLVLKVFRVNAINELIDLCGHDDPRKAYNDSPNTLRAMFGQSVIQNAVYPAKNQKEVDQFNRDFFSNTSPRHNQQGIQQQSLVVIKPNAAQQFGDVIRAHLIGQKFEIIQQKVFNLNAFVYSNMIYDAPDKYVQEIVDYMASGAVIALIVQKQNVYQELERVVGDRDPEIAASKQPESIRANYGENIVKNAIEYAGNYEIYKKNIPTFFFDVNIMNQAIDMNAIVNNIQNDITYELENDNTASPMEMEREEEMLELPEPNRDEGYAIVVIKPHVSSYQIESIQDTFADNDIQITKQKSINMPIESIREMLSIEYRNNEVIQLMANHLSSDEILVWLVNSKINNRNIFNILSNIIPSIRDQYGIDEIRDVMHYSTTNHNFKAIAHEFFFEFSGPTPPKTPNINLKLKSMDQIHQPIVDDNGNVTTELKHGRRHTEVKPFISQFTNEQKSIVLIKPHITKNQLFQIRKMLHDVSIEVIKENTMSLPIDILYNAFEMDGYDDSEYHSMCQYISSDEFIIWLVQRENVYEQLRYVIGPEDPRDAKQKYPQSIRAYYGLDKVRNAIYFSPNEHIYNHQVGIFFFQNDDDNDDGMGTDIPHVPDVNDIDYIHNKLQQHIAAKEEQDADVLYGDDEYALILLSSEVTSNIGILTQIKNRITQNRFVIVDELNTYLPPTIVSEMFNDGYTSFECDGPPIPKQQFDKLLNYFTSGEILALHVSRQNGYMLLDQLRLELEKHKLMCQIYITLGIKDYKSKCVHFFESDESDENETENNKSENNNNKKAYNNLADNNERAIMIFKPNVTDEQKRHIREMIVDEMLHVFDETSTYIPRKTLRDLLNHEGYDEYYMDQLCEFMAGHALEAWLIKGENVYKELMLIVGPEDSDVARVQAPNSIRAKYGIDKIQNVLYFTKNKQIFEETHRYFFFDEPELDHNDNIEMQSSHSSSTSKRNNKPLQQQFDEFEAKSGGTKTVLTAPNPPLIESDEEQRGILILQHYLNESEIEGIKIILDSKDIDIIQEKTSYLPMDTYKTIFELSKPYWNVNKIEQMASYYNKDECTCFLLAKPNLYNLLPKLVGNENPLLAEKGTIRQLFGHSEIRNVCFFTSNIQSYKAVVGDLFFEHTQEQQQMNNHINNQNKINHTNTSLRNIGAPSVSSYGGSNAQTNISTNAPNSINGIEKSILVFKPHMEGTSIRECNDIFLNNNLHIIQQKTCYLPSDVWHKCMKDEVVDDAHLAIEAQHLSSGSITAYLIMGENVFDALADIIGPSEPSVAKLHMPESIRAMYGIDEVRNCCWWSKNSHTYKKIFHKFFFSEKIPEHLQLQWAQNNRNTYNGNNTIVHLNDDRSVDNKSDNTASSYQYSTSKYRPQYNANKSETVSISSSIAGTDKTLLIIKPHVNKQNRKAIRNALTSNGITIIQEKYTHLAKESCKYLLNAEGYDSEYIEILAQELNKGELCAMLITKEGIFHELKEIMGPSDPQVAKKINPNSIRALYGKDVVKNCVYYTKSKRHYKKVFSFFFFEDASEKPIDELDEFDNSNSGLLTADNNGQPYTLPNNMDNDNNDDEDDTVSVTSYGYHSHVYYNQCAPCAVLIIKPHAMDKQREIELLLQSHDIEILARRSAAIHSDAIYGFLKSNQTFNSLNKQVMNMIVDDMCNGNVCVYSLGDKLNKSFNSVEKGLFKVQEITKIISEKYGLDQIRNAVYCSRDIDEMRKQRKFFFLDSVFFKSETIEDSYQYSLMIIKPNAFQYRKKITQLLKSKEFNVVVNKKMENMNLSLAQQFFHPYYSNDMQFDEYCEGMTTGQYAIVMVSRIGNCINALRQFTEQIQAMYSIDDQSIVDMAVYTSQCETDFWRDRAFFFFNEEKSIQFTDNGSVSSFRSPKKTPKKNKLNNYISATSGQSETQSITSHLSQSFALNPIEETILLIKPHAVKYSNDVENFLISHGFFIAKSRPMNMPTMVWEDFYRQYENKPWFNKLCSAMAEDQIKSYLLYRINAIKYLRELVGPTDVQQAKLTKPNCLRARYGIDIIRNGFHASHTEEDVIKERSELFFEDTDTQTIDRQERIDRIFVIIKPNCAKEFGDNIRTHLVGKGYEIVKEKVFHLSETIYQNLSLENMQYDNIKYLASDQIIVMIVEKYDGYKNILTVCGNKNPLIAKQNQPNSIRAIYGKNQIENAIEISINMEQYKQNYDVFFDDDEYENISDTHSYKMKKNKLLQKKLKLNKYNQNNKKEKCLLIIKPHINQQNINYIKQMLISNEFEIMSEKIMNLPYDEFMDAFENDIQQKNDLDAICREWSSGEITIFVISKLNVFQTIKTLVGPNDPEIARSEAPNSIRANFGIDRIRNCCWYSPNLHQYKLKLQSFEY